MQGDEFSWWRKALLKQASDPVAEEPQAGFYKMATDKDKPAQAVALWHEHGKLVARVGMTFHEPAAVWMQVCRSPISYDDYLHYRTTGSWKDHPATPDGVHTRDLKKAAPVY